MRKTNYKGRCEKKVLSKCKTLFKSYDPIQLTYADNLELNPTVLHIGIYPVASVVACRKFLISSPIILYS